MKLQMKQMVIIRFVMMISTKLLLISHFNLAKIHSIIFVRQSHQNNQTSTQDGHINY